MALDSYVQQQRIAVSAGIGELRGNGQFVSRTSILTVAVAGMKKRLPTILDLDGSPPPR